MRYIHTPPQVSETYFTGKCNLSARTIYKWKKCCHWIQ